MLYVIRLMRGDCLVTDARDERAARNLATALTAEDGESIVSIRQLPRFGVRFSPSDQGSLEVHSWDDGTLDDVLINEYPILNQEFHRANAIPFGLTTTGSGPVLQQLKEAHEENTEIIRKALQMERERFSHEPAASTRKATQK